MRLATIRREGEEMAAMVLPGGTMPVEIDGARYADLLLKEISLVGTKSCTRGELDDVLSLVADGSLEVEVVRSVPLEEGEEIHRRMENGRAEGRLVIEVAGDGQVPVNVQEGF